MIKSLLRSKTNLRPLSMYKMFSSGTEQEQSSFNIKDRQLDGRPLYMDSGATTILDFRVLDKMMPFMTDKFGNPHSRSHQYGWEAEEACEVARAEIAQVINADPKEIIFTSGATEANNMAIKGLANYYGRDNGDGAPKKHFITSTLEHKCVLDSMRNLMDKGFDVTFLDVDASGQIKPEDLKKAIRKDTIGFSAIAVHNEIGTINKLAELGSICRENKVIFHTDCAQAFGKIPLNVKDMCIDLMSISGHKIYGPMGIGALYVRKGKPRPRVRILPLFSGGGQERGLRSGTLAPSVRLFGKYLIGQLCAGLGEAARIARLSMAQDHAYVQRLSDKFLSAIRQLTMVHLNGSEEERYPGIINLSFEYVEGESMIMGIKNISVSSGSACTSASLEPSYVIRALGHKENISHTSIRFGFTRFTTEDEVDLAVEIIKDRVKVLRAMSPFLEDDSDDDDIKVDWVGVGGQVKY